MNAMSQSTESLFDEGAIRTHLDFIFGQVDFQPGQHVCLRGIGEKGTSQEGKFREEFFFEPSVKPEWQDAVIEHCRRWGKHSVASFIVPCVLKGPKATADNVALFTTVVADFDIGNTDERLGWVAENIGLPHMVVQSGGQTDEGSPKRHAWWRIEPTEDISGTVELRHVLAEKAGADLSMGRGVKSNPLGRAHQPVRIAGTIHGKSNQKNPCWIEHQTDQSFQLRELSARVAEVPPAPWSISHNIVPGMFSPASTNSSQDELDLNRDVHAGGTSTTRFSEFNRVAGHYIHCVRRGDMTLEEAFNACAGWAYDHMIPCWPDHRLTREWNALVQQDVSSNGKFPEQKALREDAQLAAGGSILDWAAHKWITDPVPQHVHLVQDILIKGEPHLFVGEGGSGKTFLVEDLALKIASFRDGDQHTWCGQKILSGGTAVLILCEDSVTETHIRIKQLDTGGLIDRAGDRLIVLPMTQLGGAFPLTERDFKTGTTVSSSKWRALMDAMKALKDPPVLVAIDTFNSVSHGDENSNVVIAEMMREAHRVCGELGAALFINHHIRKSNEPLKSLEELRNAIRGASAIPSYFRINLGMYHASDYVRRMGAMGLKPRPGQLWKFGICKANINGLLDGERTLLRSKIGLLTDVTESDPYAVSNMNERMAWMVFAIEQAAQALHPYAVGGKNAANGLYKRRAELPPMLRSIGWKEFGKLADEALQKGMIVPCAVRGSKSKAYYDVREGVLSGDEAGVVLAAGAYTTVPDWELYQYNPELGLIEKVAEGAKWRENFDPAKTTIGGRNMLVEAEDTDEDTED
jgi:hypothetical protein